MTLKRFALLAFLSAVALAQQSSVVNSLIVMVDGHPAVLTIPGAQLGRPIGAQTGVITIGTQSVMAIGQQTQGDPAAVTCTLSPTVDQATPALTGASVSCSVNGAVAYTAAYTLGSIQQLVYGATGSYTYGGNTVEWELLQPSGAGSISWQMVADGTVKGGIL